MSSEGKACSAMDRSLERGVSISRAPIKFRRQAKVPCTMEQRVGPGTNLAASPGVRRAGRSQPALLEGAHARPQDCPRCAPSLRAARAELHFVQTAPERGTPAHGRGIHSPFSPKTPLQALVV